MVRGAVAKRIEHVNNGVEAMIACEKSYAICISQPYSECNHSDQDRYTDGFDGMPKAKDQLIWLVKQGDVLFAGRPNVKKIPFSRKYTPNDDDEFALRLVIHTAEEELPQRLDELLPGTYVLSYIKK